MVGAWQIIAFNITFHDLPTQSFTAVLLDYFMQMLAGTLCLLTLGLVMSKLKRCSIFNLLGISKNNEVLGSSQTRHLSFQWRIIAIYLRACIATLGYFGFEFARSFVNVVDNSALHGADALAYALIFGLWLDNTTSNKKTAYNRYEWLGMAISACAILVVFIYEQRIVGTTPAIEGVLSGFGSSIALAIVILLTSIIVYHDSVVRVAFHNCLFGMVITGIILGVVCLLGSTNASLSDVYDMIDPHSAARSGIGYAIALLGFFQAFKYLEPIFIAMLGNSLGLGVIVTSVFIGTYESIDALITALLLVGSVMLGYQEWRKKNEEAA